MDPKKYHFNKQFGLALIIPNDCTQKVLFKKEYMDKIFVLRGPKGQKIVKVSGVLIDERPFYDLWVDNNRRFAHVKDVFLDKVFKKMEELENTPNLSRAKDQIKRRLYNLAEALAN
jgi:hypothetical protein